MLMLKIDNPYCLFFPKLPRVIRVGPNAYVKKCGMYNTGENQDFTPSLVCC